MSQSILEQLRESSSADIMSIIYEQVNSLLGAGNQLFVMEFPARPLNARNYTYAIDDCYSVLTKPYPVEEQEFALADQMFSVAPVVQGPNGDKLSTAYSTVLNNLVPKLKGVTSFMNDQKGIRRWLMADVNDEINGKKNLSRMGAAKELYGEYLVKRNDWFTRKRKIYDELKAQDKLEEYARWLSTEGLVREEEINNFYNDAVVRGNYHEVLTLLGFLNISTPAEVLENTKQKMRASQRRSLDGSSDVYPVHFQPSDWFKSLRPNLNPKDLTMALDSLRSEYRAKKSRLRSLQAMLAECAVIEIPQEDRDKLELEIKEAEKKVIQTEQNLVNQYSAGALSAFKSVMGLFREVSNPFEAAKDAISDISGAKKEKMSEQQKTIDALIEGVGVDLIQGIADSWQSQQEANTALKKLTDLRASYAEAKVKDMRLQKLRIEEEILNVQADLDFLTPLVTSTSAELAKNGTPPADAGLLTAPTAESEDNNFMDVQIKSNAEGSFSSNKSTGASSQSSWGVGGWFWSARGEKSTTQSIGQEEKKALNKKIEIGFRVKKVTIDRGGWFNPNIFKLSNNYYRLADIRFSQGLSKDKVFGSEGNTPNSKLEELAYYSMKTDGQPRNVPYVLPAFTSGFVIAKDITIRIEITGNEAKANREYMESNQQSGGGLFCFSASSSSSSKSHSESAYFGSTEKFFYIRIPGPQILGWFLQFTPMDNATPYEELDPALYSDKLEKLLARSIEDDDSKNKGNE